VIEEIDLRRTAALEQINDAPHARHEMRRRQQRRAAASWSRARSRRGLARLAGLTEQQRRIEQRRKRRGADAKARRREEMTPRAVVFQVFQCAHRSITA
jgi:hypothetical protein